MTASEIRTCVERIDGRRDALRGALSRLDAQLAEIDSRAVTLDGCRRLLSLASTKSREQAKTRIERVVTHALRQVMADESYRFEVTFVERRGRVEVEPVLHTAMSSGNPLESNGYGVVDVICTTLRLVVRLSLGLRGPLIMDEPAKFLDRAHQPNYMLMLREFAERTQTQIILSTHVTEHMEAADKVFEVSIVDGRSRIREKPAVAH